MLVFFIEKMLQVRGQLRVRMDVQSSRDAFEQTALAVNVEAEEVDRLKEREAFARGLRKRLED